MFYLRSGTPWVRVAKLVVASFAVIGAVIVASWFDRSFPVRVHFRVIETISVKPGDPFKYVNFFTRYRYCDTSVARWFVASDGVRIDIDPLPSFMPTESLNKLQVNEASIVTPKFLPPGITQACFQSTWRCNPVQRLWPLKGEQICQTFITKPRVPLPASPLSDRTPLEPKTLLGMITPGEP